MYDKGLINDLALEWKAIEATLTEDEKSNGAMEAIFNQIAEQYEGVIQATSKKYNYLGYEIVYSELLTDLFRALKDFNPNYQENDPNWKPNFNAWYYVYSQNAIRRLVGELYGKEEGGYTDKEDGLRKKGLKASLDFEFGEGRRKSTIGDSIVEENDGFATLEFENSFNHMIKKFNIKKEDVIVLRGHLAFKKQQEVADELGVSQARVAHRLKSLRNRYKGIDQYVIENFTKG